MPEGDTIFRTAVRLRSVLQGRQIQAAKSNEPTLDVAPLVSATVTAVETRGKHLLIHFDCGNVLHSHMGMTGSWHIYRPGEPWRKPERRADVVLEIADAVCICFSPKTLELLSDAGLRRHAYLKRLGPDLLADQVDFQEVISRFRMHKITPVGEAIMNQSVVCGIGNVYKSETLFLTRTDPLAAVSSLADEEILAIVRKARRLMSKNLGGLPRRTRSATGGPGLWVYGRADQPCLVCGERIEMRRQGDSGRSTYWCPQCQRASSAEA